MVWTLVSILRSLQISEIVVPVVMTSSTNTMFWSESRSG
jgi:hypothetical protein